MQDQPKKTTWFYYDKTGTIIGPIRGRELRKLAKQGIITPETRVENAEGKSGLARKVKSLKFPSTASESPVDSSVISAPKKTSWFYYDDETGEKIGPYINREIKKLAKDGVITPETRIENIEGQSCLAKHASALRFASPAASTVRVDKYDSTFDVEYGDDVNPFATVNKTAVTVAKKHSRIGHEKSVLEEKIEDLLNQGFARFRENFDFRKVKIISGGFAVALLLGISSLFFLGFQRTPSGIVYLEGTVTLDGLPVDGVNVILHPRGGEGTSAGGMTDARGRFRVTTHPAPVGSGAKAGKYDVTFSKVETMEMVMIAGRPVPASDFPHERAETFDTRRHIIPPRYGRPRTSGLEPISVEAGGRNRFTFALTSE